jgi:GDPmannose 4,6-dehydratase
LKTAMITGISGQDGAYLARHLVEKGYEVFGAYRRTSDTNFDKLRFLGVDEKIKYIPIELLEFSNLKRAIEKANPDEIYNLGGQSFVQLSFEEPLYTADVDALGPLRVLECVRSTNPKIKFYQASSSEMFGKIEASIHDENTGFHPRSSYAVSKLFGHWMTVNYREAFGMFACSGILFNHESPLRGSEFVTKKIARSVARIKLGLQGEIRLGNLEARRDWGYAPEFVEAMWLMLQQDKADDYIIATGQPHSIREFAEAAFREIGVRIEWVGTGLAEKGIDAHSGKVLVTVDPEYFRPAEVDFLKGDYSKARQKLGWSPRTTFEELVQIMVRHELKHNHQE